MAPPTTHPTTLAKHWAAQGTQGRGRGHPALKEHHRLGSKASLLPPFFRPPPWAPSKVKRVALYPSLREGRAARPSLPSVDTQRAVWGRVTVGAPSGHEPLVGLQPCSAQSRFPVLHIASGSPRLPCSLRVGAGRGNEGLRDCRGCRAGWGAVARQPQGAQSGPLRDPVHTLVPRIHWPDA